MRIARIALVLALAIVAGLAATAEAQTAKNVILLISDGQGFNQVKAADYYTGTKAVYEGSDWVKYAMQTNSANNPAGYDPASMAASFGYSMSGATDSASAASAMYTGVKIYDGQLNITPWGSTLKTIFEEAAEAGKSTGAVSSVQLSHATPAAVYAHNTSRGNYADIANEGIYSSDLTVLMGAGHGDYDNNNTYNPAVSDKYVGETATFNDMKDGEVNGFTFVDTKANFEALMTGPTPSKVLGVAQVNSTLQYNRTAGNPLNTGVPTLETMTKAALNVLDNNPNGFAVMIEAGAVDWAGHGNSSDRVIEEQVDYNNSVQAVVDWVNANSNWNETLVICTGDHETGMLWGDTTPSSFFDVDGDNVFTAGVDYPHLDDNGNGVMPGMGWNSGGHTNQLIPLYAKGAGASLFANYVIGTETNLVDMYDIAGDGFDGQYVDNTSIYEVMVEANVPEPATMGLLAIGGLALLRRRNRR